MNSISLFNISGENYNQFRPKYPKKILSQIHNLDIKTKNNYLDIATGTGQLYFDIYQDYSNIICANDISEVQLNSLIKEREKEDHTNNKVNNDKRKYYYILSDGMHLKEKIKESGCEDVKFNLITIAEAFHWFEEEKLLEYLKETLLDEDGVLFITSYYLDGITYITKDEELNKKAGERYRKLNNAIEQYMHTKLKISLKNFYSNVNFTKFFAIQATEQFENEDIMPLSSFLKYIGTFSFYNIYVKENPNLPDPLEIAKKEILEDLPNETDPLIIVFHPYYCISLKNK